MSEEVNYSTYSLMQTGKPIKSYRKTILGQLTVSVLNSFTGKPEIILLFGEGVSANSIVKLWNDKELAFFLKANVRAIETGKLISYETPEKTPDIIVEPYADATDEKLDEILDTKKTPWFSLVEIVKDVKSESVLIRLLVRARVLERSEKVIELLKTRLSEVQGFTEMEEEE